MPKSSTKPMRAKFKPEQRKIMDLEVDHRFDTTVMQSKTARNLCQIIAKLSVLLETRSKNGDLEVRRELQSAKSVEKALEDARNWTGK